MSLSLRDCVFYLHRPVVVGIHRDSKDLFGDNFNHYGIEHLMYWKDQVKVAHVQQKLCHLVRLGLLVDGSCFSWSLPTTVSVYAEKVCTI